MKARIAVAAVCLPALVAALMLPAPATAALVCAISAISAYELIKAAGAGGRFVTAAGASSAVLVVLGEFLYPGGETYLAVSLALTALTCTRSALRYGKVGSGGAVATLTVIFAGAVAPKLLSSLVWLRTLDGGERYVMLPFVSAFLTDAGAYFTGVAVGKHKAFGAVSPGKTVEGCAGGVAAGVAGTAIFSASALGGRMSVTEILAVGVIGAVMTQLGDLTFSYFKRELNVKDFGKILPGHGGVLDRFDSMVFVAPTVHLIVRAGMELM
jgi:phosphatidate cytidylyltransferase